MKGIEVELADHKNFNWVAGMKTLCGVRMREGWVITTWLPLQDLYPPVPDLSDAATRGCLLSQIRDLYQDKGAYCAKFDEGWTIVLWPENPISEEFFSTESVALASAIIKY